MLKHTLELLHPFIAAINFLCFFSNVEQEKMMHRFLWPSVMSPNTQTVFMFASDNYMKPKKHPKNWVPNVSQTERAFYYNAIVFGFIKKLLLLSIAILSFCHFSSSKKTNNTVVMQNKIYHRFVIHKIWSHLK